MDLSIVNKRSLHKDERLPPLSRSRILDIIPHSHDAPFGRFLLLRSVGYESRNSSKLPPFRFRSQFHLDSSCHKNSHTTVQCGWLERKKASRGDSAYFCGMSLQTTKSSYFLQCPKMMESLAKLLWPQVKSPHSRNYCDLLKEKLERGRFGLAVGLAWVDVGLVFLFTLVWCGTTLNHPQDLLKNLCSELQRLGRISITSKSQAWNEACRAVSSLVEPGKMPLWLGRNKVWSLRVDISAREAGQLVVHPKWWFILFKTFPAGWKRVWFCHARVAQKMTSINSASKIKMFHQTMLVGVRLTETNIASLEDYDDFFVLLVGSL